MPKKAEAISAKALESRVASTVKAGKECLIAVGGVDGLSLRLRKNAQGGFNRTWVLRSQQKDGKKFWFTLGAYPEISLSKARAIANEERNKAEQGINPVKQRREERYSARANLIKEQENAKRSESFQSVAVRCFDVLEFPNERVKRSEWDRLNKHVLSVIGSKPISECTPEVVLDVYKRAVEGGVSGASIKKFQQKLNAVLNFAVSELTIEENPTYSARFKTLRASLPKPRDENAHHGALLPDELPDFIAHVVELIISRDDKNRGSMSARCLLFSILTCLRSANARGAKWADIAPDFSSMTISAHEMKESKNGNHTVFFAPEVRDLVRALPQLDYSPYVFVSTRASSLSDSAFTQIINELNAERDANGLAPYTDAEQSKKLGRAKRITQHGLARATFTVWCQMTGANVFARELMLHHEVKGVGGLGEAYERHDYAKERRAIYDAWAKFCLSKTPLERWELVVNREKYAKEQ